MGQAVHPSEIVSRLGITAPRRPPFGIIRSWLRRLTESSQHTAQMKEMDGIGHGGQRGLMGAQRSEPGQNVRVAAQVLEGLYVRIVVTVHSLDMRVQ